MKKIAVYLLLSFIAKNSPALAAEITQTGNFQIDAPEISGVMPHPAGFYAVNVINGKPSGGTYFLNPDGSVRFKKLGSATNIAPVVLADGNIVSVFYDSVGDQKVGYVAKPDGTPVNTISSPVVSAGRATSPFQMPNGNLLFWGNTGFNTAALQLFTEAGNLIGTVPLNQNFVMDAPLPLSNGQYLVMTHSQNHNQALFVDQSGATVHSVSLDGNLCNAMLELSNRQIVIACVNESGSLVTIEKDDVLTLLDQEGNVVATTKINDGGGCGLSPGCLQPLADGFLTSARLSGEVLRLDSQLRTVQKMKVGPQVNTPVYFSDGAVAVRTLTEGLQRLVVLNPDFSTRASMPLSCLPSSSSHHLTRTLASSISIPSAFVLPGDRLMLVCGLDDPSVVFYNKQAEVILKRTEIPGSYPVAPAWISDSGFAYSVNFAGAAGSAVRMFSFGEHPAN